jgi:hypothetical protein
LPALVENFIKSLTMSKDVSSGSSGCGDTPDFAIVYVVIGAPVAYGSYTLPTGGLASGRLPTAQHTTEGAVIYVIHLAGLAVRIAIELICIGSQVFPFSPSAAPATLSASAMDAEIATGVLLALGSGLSVREEREVVKRLAAIVEGKETLLPPLRGYPSRSSPRPTWSYLHHSL